MHDVQLCKQMSCNRAVNLIVLVEYIEVFCANAYAQHFADEYISLHVMIKNMSCKK